MAAWGASATPTEHCQLLPHGNAMPSEFSKETGNPDFSTYSTG